MSYMISNAVAAFIPSSELSPVERLVLLKIASHARDDGSRAFPGERGIAAFAGCSERTARTAVRTLEARGLLRTEKRPGRSNLYTVVVARLTPAIDDTTPAIDDTTPATDDTTPATASGESVITSPLNLYEPVRVSPLDGASFADAHSAGRAKGEHDEASNSNSSASEQVSGERNDHAQDEAMLRRDERSRSYVAALKLINRWLNQHPNVTKPEGKVVTGLAGLAGEVGVDVFETWLYGDGQQPRDASFTLRSVFVAAKDTFFESGWYAERELDEVLDAIAWHRREWLGAA